MYRETLGKKIYAYEGNKHSPCTYSYMGTITGIDNELVYIHSNDNPKGYQDYTITKINFNKWINEKLYILK